MLPHFLLKSEAWESLKPVPRALFIEVAQRWNGFNNGRIGLGIREAGQAIHVKHTTAMDRLPSAAGAGLPGADARQLLRPEEACPRMASDGFSHGRLPAADRARDEESSLAGGPRLKIKTQDRLSTRIGPNWNPTSRQSGAENAPTGC